LLYFDFPLYPSIYSFHFSQGAFTSRESKKETFRGSNAVRAKRSKGREAPPFVLLLFYVCWEGAWRQWRVNGFDIIAWDGEMKIMEMGRWRGDFM